jgi:hypothetical protein
MDHARVRPTPRSRLAVGSELIHTAPRALEPAIVIAQQNSAGIRRYSAELSGTGLARCSATRRWQALAAGTRSSPAGGFRRQETDRPAGARAHSATVCVGDLPWLIRARVDQHVHPIARSTDRHETKAEAPAQTVHAWMSGRGLAGLPALPATLHPPRASDP